ncbi:GNAT family N-acetyltransferase [Streptococcus sp. A11]|uniref:GNAT family N-acetyltransferase n=1 Tax=unclassified Streptococcus TaxID=2608887 RepID=UPI00374D1148
MSNLELLPLTEQALLTIWKIGFSDEKPYWKEFAAPYFDDYQAYRDFTNFQESPRYHWFQTEEVRGILVDGEPIGMVSYYWENQATRWLEVGIEIYNENQWGKGFATLALQKWIRQIFTSMPELEHIGLTTWSGNPGMMRVAEKIGMQKEGQIRKVRYWQGYYYDSVKYGILREEWHNS